MLIAEIGRLYNERLADEREKILNGYLRDIFFNMLKNTPKEYTEWIDIILQDK